MNDQLASLEVLHVFIMSAWISFAGFFFYFVLPAGGLVSLNLVETSVPSRDYSCFMVNISRMGFSSTNYLANYLAIIKVMKFLCAHMKV